MLMLKNKKLVTMLLLAAGVLVSKPAFSAPAQAPAEATAQLGVALPLVGDLEDIADTGVFFGAQMMQQVNPRKSYGVGVSYYSFGKDSEQNVDTEVSIISTMLLGRTTLSARGTGTPFIETGLGFARTQVNIETPGNTGPAVTRGDNEEDFSPTFLLGLGFDMPISDGASLGLSVDYQHFFFKVGDVDGGGTLSFLAHLRV